MYIYIYIQEASIVMCLVPGLSFVWATGQLPCSLKLSSASTVISKLQTKRPSPDKASDGCVRSSTADSRFHGRQSKGDSLRPQSNFKQRSTSVATPTAAPKRAPTRRHCC